MFTFLNFKAKWRQPQASPLPQALYLDDFYENVDQIRKIALGAQYQYSSAAFKGGEAKSEAVEVQAVMNRIADLLGERICFKRKNQGVFRVLSAAQEQAKTRQVHIDRMGYASVLCLNPVDFGSTAFFRHVLTGIDNVDAVEPVARKLGVSSAEIFALLDLDGGDLSKWEQIGGIEYRYNRMIIFDTNYFHVAAPGRGETLHNAKMTQNFNFYFRRQLSLLERLRYSSTPA